MEEGIKANRHKAIDRGRSSRSLMAWKNSESQANFALRLGAGRGSCAPDTNVAANKEYTRWYHRTWSPLFSLPRSLLRARQPPSFTNAYLFLTAVRLNVGH